MSASTSGQAEPPAGPEAGATPRGDSTSGQRAALAGRLRRHVATLEGVRHPRAAPERHRAARDYVDRKSTRLNSSHANISYAVFCLKKKKKKQPNSKDTPSTSII